MLLLHFHFRNQTRPLKGTGSKRDVCLGSLVSTGEKLPVSPAGSASPTVGPTFLKEYGPLYFYIGLEDG